MKNSFGRDSLSVEDCEIEIGPCPTCRAIATEAEALLAKASWLEVYPERTHCGACDKTILVQGIILFHDHESDTGRSTWRILGIQFEPALFFIASGRRGQAMHLECAKLALPFATWESEHFSDLDRIRHVFPDVYPRSEENSQ
jgi:hypothetical protein